MKITRILILFCPLLFACGRFNNEQKNEIKKQRVVCIAKQYTEIIFALGAEEELVAVDLSSTFPEAAKKLPTVGYHRALSLESMLAQQPDLIIHDNNVGPDHVMAQLEKLKIPMKTFKKYSQTISGTDSLIREMGIYFNKEKQADSLCKKLAADMLQVESEMATKEPAKKICIIHYGQASNVYLTMTAKSTAAKMVNWAGAKISVEGEKGMVPLSAEVIAKSNPDILFLTDFGFDKLGNIEKIKELPGVAGTNAAKNNRIYRIEEHDLVYLGPRTGENVMLIKKMINNNVAK